MSFPNHINIGSITAAGQTLGMSVLGFSTLSTQFSGTWTGTVVFEVSTDNISWVPVSAQFLGVGTNVATISGNGVWSINVFAYPAARIRATAWTSGTLSVDVVEKATGSYTFGGLGSGGTISSGADHTIAMYVSSGTTLGNSIITQTGVTGVTASGDMLVTGTATAGTKVVSPALQITGGAVAAGQVLTSDASGNAAWATPVTGSGSGTVSSAAQYAIARYTLNPTGTTVGASNIVDNGTLVTITGPMTATGIVTSNSKLVAPALQITGGTTAPGYVLTSDINGNATWAPVATGSGTITSGIDRVIPMYVGNGTQIGPSILSQTGTTSATVGGDATITGTATIGTQVITPALQVSGGSVASGMVLTSDAVGNAAWGPRPYDMGGYFPGQPTASQYDQAVSPRVLMLANGASGVARATVGATAVATFTLTRVSGTVTTNIGTITFAVGGQGSWQAGVVSIAGGPYLFNPLDLVRITAPAPFDTSLSDMTWALTFTIGGALFPTATAASVSTGRGSLP